MKTANWIIKRVKNPCPESWPGPWFSFEKMEGSTKQGYHRGTANWKTLPLYIGEHDMERVRVHFRKTMPPIDSPLPKGLPAPKMVIPLCHKCCDGIWKPDQKQVLSKEGNVIVPRIVPNIFVGCKKCANIKNWDDAKKLCPILPKND